MSVELLSISTPADHADIKRLWNRLSGHPEPDMDEPPLVGEVREGYARDWSFTPLRHGADSKKPLLKDWQTRPRATLDKVTQWARQGNVGLRTGTASGVVVLDVDETKGGRLPCPIPVTVTVETGGGGRHYYFAYTPECADLRNHVGKIAEHVDIRTTGGQVVYVGSVHPETGALYEWADGLTPDDVPPAPFPGVLLDLFRKQAERPAPTPPAPRLTPVDLRNKYVEKALTLEIEALTSTPEGQRNDRLNVAAFNLGQLVNQGLNPGETTELLLHAALRAGLTESEARATIRSGLTKGQDHPRTVPERSAPPAPTSYSPTSSLGGTGVADSTAAIPASAVAPWEPCDILKWFEQDPPPQEWVLDEMLARGDVGLLIAAGGTGKTWLMLEIAMSLASGVTLLPSLRPLRPSRVMFLSGEDREDILWRRSRHVSGLFTRESLVAQNLRVFAGSSEPLTATSPTGLQRTARFEWLLRQVQEFQPDLILIDPKSRWDGGDENDPVSSTAFVVALQELAGQGAAVLLAHHIRKASTGALDSDAARGSTALRDAVRWAATMAPLGDVEARDLGVENPRQFVKLDVSKANYSAGLPKPIILKRGEGGLLEEVDFSNSRGDRMGEFIARWFADVAIEMNLRDLRQRRTEQAKELAKAVAEEFRRPKRSDVDDAVQRAMSAGLLVCRTEGRAVFVSAHSRLSQDENSKFTDH